MKYNPHSIYEEPPEKAPDRCSSCKYFRKGNAYDYCKANNTDHIIYDAPIRDRIEYSYLHCPWWYIGWNNSYLQSKLEGADGYKEQRLHAFTADEFLKSLPLYSVVRKDFIGHYFRKGGGKIIDFNIYPECKEIYEKIKNLDKNGK